MEGERVTVYFDYTCPYSYRAFLWLRQIVAEERSPAITWRAFSLKEVNRPEEVPSIFAPGKPGGVALLALELAKAAEAAGQDVFNRYHGEVYERMQGQGERLTRADLLGIAGRAGLDVERFQPEMERWRAAVAADHHLGVERWRVFGTPTLVLDDEAAVYLKFTAAPSPEGSAKLFDALLTLARCHPELIEIKYPQPIPPPASGAGV